MKKLIVLASVILILGSVVFTSCSRKRLCPAYPPSVYHRESGDALENENEKLIDEQNMGVNQI